MNKIIKTKYDLFLYSPSFGIILAVRCYRTSYDRLYTYQCPIKLVFDRDLFFGETYKMTGMAHHCEPEGCGR